MYDSLVLAMKRRTDHFNKYQYTNPHHGEKLQMMLRRVEI
jgi:hypothetical protein